MNKCPKCGYLFNGTFCPQCGTRAYTPPVKTNNTKPIIVIVCVVIGIIIIANIFNIPSNTDTAQQSSNQSTDNTRISSGQSNDVQSNETQSPEAATPATSNINKHDSEGAIGKKYYIVIKSCELSTDITEAPIAIITYEFTNYDDDPHSFYVFDDLVYQNGIECTASYFINDRDDYFDNASRDIKQGKSITVKCAYELFDTTTNVDVEVTELFGFNNDIVTKTFSIS